MICIYCRSSFDRARGEHVLQNFLGARFTSDAIVCDTHQQNFGDTIDVALEKSLQPIRNLLGTRGGRKGEGPTLKNLRSSTGERLHLAPGGQPLIAEPTVEILQVANDTSTVKITVGTANQFGWALSKLRRLVPNLTVDVEQVRSMARNTEGFVSGHLELPLTLGGRDYFRALAKACFNFLGAYFPDRALAPSFDGVRDFVLKGNGDMGDFVRWSGDKNPLPIPNLGQADHFIGLVTRDSVVEGIVQLFGGIVHPVRLSDSYVGPAFTLGYLVDPFREVTPAEVRNPEFDPDVVPPFLDQYARPGEAVWEPFRIRLSQIVALHSDRADQQLVAKVIDEVLKPHEGEPFTEELAAQFSQRLAERFSARLTQRESATLQ